MLQWNPLKQTPLEPLLCIQSMEAATVSHIIYDSGASSTFLVGVPNGFLREQCQGRKGVETFIARQHTRRLRNEKEQRYRQLTTRI